MNDKIVSLIERILDSNLSRETKEEIVRFYLLPRNTNVKPTIEITDTPVGVVKRPDAHDLLRKENPRMAETEDAMRSLLKGVDE